MKYLIFSDVHGNLPALQKLEELAQDLEYDRIVNLGDTVGYGAFPIECVHQVIEFADVNLSGNHDQAVTGQLHMTNWNMSARQAILWTRKVIEQDDPEVMDLLGGMNTEIVENGVHLAHASPFESSFFHYVIDDREIMATFGAMKTDVCFIGHSHKPVTYSREKGVIEINQGAPKFSLNLYEDIQWIVNVGSVGQPRDGNSWLSFVIYDTNTRILTRHRKEYDVNKAQQAILQSGQRTNDEGLPEYCAERLASGR